METQTLKQALAGGSQRIIGKVMSAGVAYKLGLRNNPGYGCVVPFLKYGAAAPYNFGRFGYDQTVEGMIAFLKSQRLADDAVVTLL
jgi:hypothetical protein